MHNSFIIREIRKIRGFYFPLLHQNPRMRWGVENGGTCPVMRVLAELGLGVPGAMFLGSFMRRQAGRAVFPHRQDACFPTRER